MAGDLLTGFGLQARLPTGWEGRLSMRPRPTAPFSGQVRQATPSQTVGWAGEDVRPVMHLADFPLPAQRGDYGSGALEVMPDRRVFVALLEFGEQEAGSALFAPLGVPRPRLADFSPDALQRRQRGQRGYQRFFTAAGRPFCLYVVLGAAGDHAAVTTVNQVLDGVTVS